MNPRPVLYPSPKAIGNRQTPKGRLQMRTATGETEIHIPSTGRAFVYVAAIFAALGGLLFGYDTGVVSGALLFFRRDFTLSTLALEVIVSGVLGGAAVGALIGGRLGDLFGRRRLLIATAT